MNTKDRFVVNFKILSDKPFGTIVDTVVHQRDAKCSKEFKIIGDFCKNIYVACRFKNLNYSILSDFILYNKHQLRVRFEPKEKNVDPVIHPLNTPKPRIGSANGRQEIPQLATL